MATAASGNRYVGRFAPSPTGLLHAGSLVAALGSWLDACAHAGRWLVRIEDVDTPRCPAGAAEAILAQLARCGLLPDEPVLWQSRRGATYARALDDLLARGRAYACTCTRSQINAALAASGRPHHPHAELVYPGSCRPAEAQPVTTRPAERHALRLRVEPGAAGLVAWHDRRLGAQRQDVADAVGDFVLRRADGLWAYQLAVVVDDAAQGISHVVRGADLADNTPRQILLQQALGLATPAYLHLPLVLAADGHKLSKQNGARPLDLAEPLAALNQAAAVLDLAAAAPATPVADALASWTLAWAARWHGTAAATSAATDTIAAAGTASITPTITPTITTST
ncbi:MAG: Glutamyl-Q tRNA(Asp) synthetase [Pseudomonadota bacterium]